MPPTCCIPLCKSSKIKNPDIGLYKFPTWSDKIKIGGEMVNRRNIWMNAIGVSEVTARMRVCSLHFTENDLFKGCGKIRRLKRNAIPSVNLTPPVIQSLNSAINDILIPGSVPSLNMLSNSEDQIDSLSSTAENRKLKLDEESLNIKVEELTSLADEYTSDNFNYDFSQVDMEHVFDTPESAKINFKLAFSQMNALKKKIICLKTKVKCLQKYINHLKNNNLISKDAHSSIQIIISSIVHDT